MEKKILKIQLYSLFILTTLNLLYFHYRDNLPDNYYEISYHNESINFFTYYFFSVLANFGYWCGIWVTASFVCFALLHSLVFTKKNDLKNQWVIASLLPLTIGLCYFILPETLGEGLYSLVRENFSGPIVFLSVLVFGSILFYLVSEKNFFKTCAWIWKQLLSFTEMVKTADYSGMTNALKNINKESIAAKFLEIKARFQRMPVPVLDAPKAPMKLKITPLPAAKPIPAPIAEEVEDEDEEEEIDIESVDELDEEETEEEELEDFDDSVDSVEDESEEDEEDDELEDVDGPKSRRNDEFKFFDSSELISCIAPKKHAHSANDQDEAYFHSIARAIEDKLKEFNISAQIINVLKGPVVDTFELELGSGVKVTNVVNLTNDLGLALKGAQIRMVYPMKGKTTIGIEVPRNPRDVIYLDEVLKSELYNRSSFRLPIAMGKDAYGDPAVIDLAATPHLLVAGTTGAGKSVFINTLLVSLIIRFSPKNLKLIMIDPKQLELALYQRLPHLIMPVVTDSQIASVALLWAIDEMERRYSLLKDYGVKNIDGFNKKVSSVGPELKAKITKYYPDAEKENFELPFIVIVVDEFADLKLSKSGNAIETSISRLAAKARASGIHIVLATQRPSTDIITGVIKANFPTRVSFRVFTNTDSRVILDGMGAEKLLGKGDMLFKQGVDILRMHSAYVDEDEIEKLVDKLATIPPQFDLSAMEFIETSGIADDDTEGMSMDMETNKVNDEKYDEAVRVVATHRTASASYLQRRIGVGYNRAANLIEEMERRGIVGPGEGSKPRKVLIPPPADSTP
jgi:DNA segregation ATPase FtsK/SpoIIIE, S-DNA-T family